MARFDFQSPGAAFTDEITKVLAERKAEERQKMLDSLTMAAEQRAATEQANQQEYRKLQMEQARRDQQLQELGIIAGNMQMGDDPRARGLSDEAIELGRSMGMWNEQAAPVQPSVSADTEFRMEDGQSLEGPQEPTALTQSPAEPAQPRLGYVGNEKERERDRRSKLEARLITEMLASNDPERAQLGQALTAVANANGGFLPDSIHGMLFEEMMPAQEAQIFDQVTGKITKGPKVKRNVPTFTRNHPPRNPQERMPIRVGVSKNGRNLYMGVDGREFEGDIAVANDPNESPLGIPSGTQDRHLISIAMMGDDPTEPSNIARFQATAKEFAANAKGVSARVRQIAMRFADNPAEGASLLTQNIPTMSPDEKQQLDMIMSVTQLKRYQKELQTLVPVQPPTKSDDRLTDAMLNRVK